ncbi:immunoglobulin lambda-1 light chain [Microcaecilia unicolor]|uniref:immunoglobulin lambda-1 light chain-like n=1 Tax=Microcaecilia unicolor TaxID=1415580 RepID=UPI001187040C|nr:immunoglobulin lambda-1 light chain-like [Microcaecilia unicolor]
MSWTQVLCFSLLLVSLASSEYATLVQSTPLLAVSPGATARLQCEVKNVKPETLFMNWIRQSPGQRPEGVLSYSKEQNVYRAPNITDRFVPSRDTSNHFLTISNVQAQDDSVYYCFVYYSSAGVQTWGEGTRLRVNGGDRRKPKVSLFPPAQEEINTSDRGTLSCLVSGFYPGYLEVLWQVDGEERSQEVLKGQAALGEDHTYSLSSYLSIPGEEWKKGSRYTCVVKHEALENSLETSVTYRECSSLQ